jgi:transcriptional regulator with XRE-family HTH domain
MSTFADRLHMALERHNMSQRDLASATGLCETLISHLATGKRDPNLQSLRRIVDALPRADARWLIGGKAVGVSEGR